jgi:pimeloyl-ACP methyl ester carboxylesterase
MSAPHPTDRRFGPVVVLLHGVGVGPESFALVAERLAGRHHVVALERPTGPGGSALPLDDQADQLARMLPDLGGGGVRLVGVSGGATLGLCLALRHPGAVDAMLLHEPLVGSLAPELHRRFAAAALLAGSGDDGAMEVVRSVMGDATWAELALGDRAASAALAPRWRGEIAAFAAFDPSGAALASLAPLPLIVSVGGRSGPERWAAAEVLRHRCGAELVEVPGAGNAVQLDAPDAFAELISTTQPVSAGGAP